MRENDDFLFTPDEGSGPGVPPDLLVEAPASSLPVKSNLLWSGTKIQHQYRVDKQFNGKHHRTAAFMHCLPISVLESVYINKK